MMVSILGGGGGGGMGIDDRQMLTRGGGVKI